MDPRELRLHCARLVDSLLADLTTHAGRSPDLSDPSTVAELYGDYRGWPIVVLPGVVPLTGACGPVLPGEDGDFVLYGTNTSPLHWRHLVWHGLGHLIGELQRPFEKQTLLPSGLPAYHGIEEREAEEIATELGARAARDGRYQAPAATLEVVDLVDSTLRPRLARARR